MKKRSILLFGALAMFISSLIIIEDDYKRVQALYTQKLRPKLIRSPERSPGDKPQEPEIVLCDD